MNEVKKDNNERSLKAEKDKEAPKLICEHEK